MQMCLVPWAPQDIQDIRQIYPLASPQGMQNLTLVKQTTRSGCPLQCCSQYSKPSTLSQQVSILHHKIGNEAGIEIMQTNL